MRLSVARGTRVFSAAAERLPAYQQVFDTVKLNIAFELHEVEDLGDWAWARTSSAGCTRILASGVEVDEGNNALFVFRRELGEWRIHRYLLSTSQPRM